MEYALSEARADQDDHSKVGQGGQHMQGEFFYGNDGYRRNDGYATDKPAPSAFGPQENGEITEEKEHLNINNSNSRLDKYLFYYSSKL